MKEFEGWAGAVFFSFLLFSTSWAADSRDPMDERVTEVQEEIKKTPVSSFQRVLKGVIVAQDRAQRRIVISDKRRKITTFYLAPGLTASFSNGTRVQIKARSGNNTIESIQKI